jgi:hypothetical protein
MNKALEPADGTGGAGPALEDSGESGVPLMGGPARSDGFPQAEAFDAPPRTGGRFLNQSTLLILLVFAVAGGSIYAMRMRQSDIGANPVNRTAEARVADALAKLSQPQAMDPADPLQPPNLNKLLDLNAIVDWFASDHTDRQVPLENLQKNPFVVVVMPVAPQDPKVITPQIDKQNDERLQQLKLEFGDLKLQSIVNGSRPIAVINGVFVQQGQKIGSFMVRSISGVSVELESQGKTFTLQMDASPDHGTVNALNPGPIRSH